jgi:3-oxoacyl-[acyl-carrier-protein] synthase II
MSNSTSHVITGIGILSPIGRGKEDYWDAVKKGVSGIREITIFDAFQYGCDNAGEIKGFKPEAYLGEKGLKYLARTTKLAMSAAYLCLRDAGIKSEARKYDWYDAESLGIVLGTTLGVAHSICAFQETSLVEGPSYVSPMAFPNLVMNSHAGYVAIKEDMKGLNLTVSTGYNASLDAVGIAASYLESNQVECFLVGGVEGLNEELLLWQRGRRPGPGDVHVGEGCGIYAMEKLGDAVNRRAIIYGEVAGYGSAFSETSGGLERAIREAASEARMTLDEIDYIVRGINAGEREKNIESEVIETNFGRKIRCLDLTNALGDSYSAGGSLQIGAGLGLIEQKIASNFLTVSTDPCGNSSALIIRDLNA